ncbi:MULTISPECIES: hypothetical protein [unclassified Streptomyces]|uniref:hypothetical protein n=1 Tax=unclassified Streptomyces TaxID=2593676 RepID=UPI0024A80FE9|nr:MULTISPECIES: hypothetical protein [unclassified Streptomyces]
MRTRTTTAALITASLLALTACGSEPDGPADPKKLDDAASLACDDFATGIKAALTTTARVDLANKVNKWAQDSNTNGIATGGKLLANSAEADPGTWQTSSDLFAQSCLDAGWDA